MIPPFNSRVLIAIAVVIAQMVSLMIKIPLELALIPFWFYGGIQATHTIWKAQQPQTTSGGTFIINRPAKRK
jgi:hypothetical protein